jgi:predicted ATPase
VIDRVELENFKCFAGIQVDTRQLTVVTGVNGSGKSTLLQALLLAREAALRPAAGVVPLNGPYGLALGEALDVLRVDAAEQLITITVHDEGIPYTYRFEVPNERRLHLTVTDRPDAEPPTLTQLGTDFAYLMAERLGPRDQLVVASDEVGHLGVGVQGEFTAQALAMNETLTVPERLRHPRTAEHGVVTLRTQVEEWMADIVRRLRITAQWPAGLNATLLRFEEVGSFAPSRLRPTNMGFGVSYVLPIVVAGLLARPGGLLLIENPEAHLHPAGQSLVGRFLARVASTGVQVVVETHSDHVVNGIRLAAAVDQTIESTAAVILFARDAHAGFEPIELDDAGGLSRWPAGFFDQMDLDLGRLARARQQAAGAAPGDSG